ncbi:hypothetical protein IWX49DRAFT_554446 [Phyllosticta citricarpa]|uniref:DUF21-domain-containing protein n=1 Tax=Phyllosticta citricarpa TaxID=55181 RepID=A0ABR1MK04_9PEZI
MSLAATRALAAAPFSHHRGHAAVRPIALLLASLLFSAVGYAAPLKHHTPPVRPFEDEPKSSDDAELWVFLGTAVALVLLGGAFAGLTIALMGQDEIYLQVIATSGEGAERKSAARVLNLLKKGKHWVLVTLLLSNVITNETLPIVLDRSLGGGWPAVLSSTVLIVIFGEIVPQSVCVRYGLPIGAWMSPVVLGLMYLMAPVAWPTAKLLDWLLGEDHGTTYKKAGLKTLVTLHKTLGTSPEDRLNQDEVTIISAVLDLKDKPVGSIMTPMNDVFTMSADTVLDEKMMDQILSAGYSRIPIYQPENPSNFVGMLLVKLLITYDPEDGKQVRDFALATLPETRPETSCLDIVNFFQEGKSHMVLVSDFPGEPYGALGVVTLEDVIEELIGEEIIDESDVYIDVHKAIRRMTPAPRNRIPKIDHAIEDDADETTGLLAGHERRISNDAGRSSVSQLGTSPQVKLLRRNSSGNGSLDKATPVSLRDGTSELKEQLRHLGPSNAASRPKSTRISTVKIKPSVNTIPEGPSATGGPKPEGDISAKSTPRVGPTALSGGVGEGQMRDESDALRVAASGYGTMNEGSGSPKSGSPKQGTNGSRSPTQDVNSRERSASPKNKSPTSERPSPKHRKTNSNSSDSIRSLHSGSPSHSQDRLSMPRGTARSGSISENVIDVNGVKKMVLETLGDSSGGGAENDEERKRGGSSHSNKSQRSLQRMRANGSRQNSGDGSGSGPRGGNGADTNSTGEGPSLAASGMTTPIEPNMESSQGGEGGKKKKKKKKKKAAGKNKS